MKPIIDLSAAWEAHVADVLADRDPRRIAASDLHACPRAFWGRYHGEPQLPYNNSSFSAFERGHAYETRVYNAIKAYLEKSCAGWTVERGNRIDDQGVEGHPDFIIRDEANNVVAIVDPSTTASKFGDWQYGHALKTAFYADYYECEDFAEFVICIGFGGNILSVTQHWFKLSDLFQGISWRDRVSAAIESVKAISLASDVPPAPEPPIDPLDGSQELWRCGKPGSGKSYCRAMCPRNAQLGIPMQATK